MHDVLVTQLRREQAITWLLPLFFMSGATALVYQVIWNRSLHLVFGTSTFATATVLAGFMAGLALGAEVAGRVADRLPRPLWTYGVLEIIIGVWALIFPWIIHLLTPIYLSAHDLVGGSPVMFGISQFILVVCALLVPTTCMGATLPLLARFATDRLEAAGSRVGTLYSINTFGAVAGTWLAGFIILPSMGLWWTTVLASAANIALGLAAVALDRWTGTSGEQVKVVDDLRESLPPLLVPVALVMAFAGFASMIYEVAWTRVLGLMLGGSTYAFSLMLLAFLTGIAIGGRAGGPIADRALAKRGVAGVLMTLAVIEVGVAGLSWGMMYVYPELPFWYVWLFDMFGAARDSRAVWLVNLVLSGLIMTPPAVLMGIAFPVAVRAVLGDRDSLARPVGLTYAANTIGGVFGAFLAGFVLLPGVGVQGAVLVAALANLVAAGIAVLGAAFVGRALFVRLAPIAAAGLLLVALAQRPPWDPMLMTAGMYHYVTDFDDHSRAGIMRYARELYELIYYREGLSSVVTVARNRKSGNIWLANNGKVDASTTTDMPTQVLCALLPLHHATSRDDVLVIGLASGITAGAVTLLDDVKSLEIVELEPAILEAARYFDAWNHGVLDDPRTTLVANDGRNHVLRAAPGTWDVIISEPSNPWISGVSNLFTQEFFALGKTRLKTGGVWSQWVQLYGMGEDDVRSLLATFASVYPHVLVYATIDDADLVLVGSDRPIASSRSDAERLMRQPKVFAELALIDVRAPEDLMATFLMDRAAVVKMVGSAPLNTDDNMRIEYRAPLNLHRATSSDNVRQLLKHAMLPPEAYEWDATQLEVLAESYHNRADTLRALATLVVAMRTLAADDPDRGRLAELGRRWRDSLSDDEPPSDVDLPSVDEAADEQ